MARKTKAELEAEREEQRALAEAHEFAQYPTRLMAALETATKKFNYELEVENWMFVLMNRDRPRDPPLNFTMTHNPNSQLALETLEWELKDLAEQRAERERVYLAREAALAKLTPEERKLLNL
jgi:hypothetical protein